GPDVPRQSCPIGSVKTNIGHLAPAAGVAGLIKTVLALKNEVIPPSLNFKTPNPEIDFQNSPFFVNTSLRLWLRGPKPRRAAISSFGVGGPNSHVVIEEPPLRETTLPDSPWQLFPISARTTEALSRRASQFEQYYLAAPDASLSQSAWTLQTGRRHFQHRQ